jgi:hypothetical protein
MKIQAKDVKVGMTVKWGVVTITVSEIVPFTQKNGITGKIFYGSATRSYGRGVKPTFYKSYDINAKDESWLTLK